LIWFKVWRRRPTFTPIHSNKETSSVDASLTLETRPRGAAAADPSALLDSVSIAIAGSGGSGVMTAGTWLLDAAAASGRYGLMVRTMGPQIRGGEAAALVRLASAQLESLDDDFDVLLAKSVGKDLRQLLIVFDQQQSHLRNVPVPSSRNSDTRPRLSVTNVTNCRPSAASLQMMRKVS
jgi:hypothetical protein